MFFSWIVHHAPHRKAPRIRGPGGPRDPADAHHRTVGPLLTIALALLLPVPALADPATEWTGPVLKTLARRHGIEVGAMGTLNPWNAATQTTESEEFSDPDYVAFAALHFDRITSGQNFLPFNVWDRPADLDDPATYVYLPDGAQYVEIASGFDIHGAHMIWHGGLAPWMSVEQGFSGPDVETFMNHHIDNLVARYPTLTSWVVVNEAVADVPVSTTSHVPGNLRDTIWKQEIGDDFVFAAFARATQAGVATRIYNDYGTELPDAPKTLAVLELVRELRARDLVDGVGFQMHLRGDVAPPTFEQVRSNFEQFAALGVDVHVTELDVSRCNDAQCRDVTAPQAVHDVALACRVVEACRSFSFWGIRNDLSWLHPSHVAPEQAAWSSLHPLPFDADYAPMPMFDALVAAWAVPAVPAVPAGAWAALAAGLLAVGVHARRRLRHARSA